MMIGKKERETLDNRLDSEILNAAKALENLDPKSDEYARIVRNAKSLHEIKDDSSKLNINTVVSVGGSLLVCVLAIGFEKFGNGIFPWKISGFMPRK